jgi:hypothetical protein
MKLRDATLCVECEEMFDPSETRRGDGGEWTRCPACGNDITVRIACWVRTMYDYERTWQPLDLEEARK